MRSLHPSSLSSPKTFNTPPTRPVICTMFTDMSSRILSLAHRFANFSDFMLPNHWRLVNNHDMVPHVPPEDIGFKHDSVEIWYHNGTHTSCGPQEDASCSNSVPKYDLNIGDHLFYLNISHRCSPM